MNSNKKIFKLIKTIVNECLTEVKDSQITNLVLEVRNKWIEEYGSEEDAESEAMYASCDQFSYDVVQLLNANSIKFDLLNSITYTERVGGVSGYHSLIKMQNYKNWYSELPKELNNDRYFGNYEFPAHEWLYIDGKHYDFMNFDGADSVFDMKWMIDYFSYVKSAKN